MIKPVILSPSVVEPGAQVELDGSRSFDTDSPFTHLALSWAQAGGTPGALEIQGGRLLFTASPESVVEETITFLLTARNPDTGQSATAAAAVSCVQLISSDMITLSAQLPAGATILPRGAWSFDVDITAAGGEPMLRSLCPALLRTRIAVGNVVATVPTVVHRRWLDRWRVYVQAAPVGETKLLLLTETVRAEVPEEGKPALVLRRPASSTSSILWRRNDGQDEVIAIPWIEHKPGSVVIFLNERMRERFEQGEDGLFEVRYYAQDYAEHSGWYAGLGLGPSDSADATLLVAYGAGSFVDPGLDVTAAPWNVGLEAHWTAPVRLAGRLMAHPYYHLWKREGDHVLLRESYEGIVRE